MFPALTRTARLLPLALLATLLLACTREVSTPAVTTVGATATFGVTPTESSTARPSLYPTSTATRVRSASGQPAGAPGTVIVKFSDPGAPLPTVVRSIGSRTGPSFSPRPSGSPDVVLYDVQAGTERVIGSGRQPLFNPSGTRIAWVSDSSGRREVMVFTLTTSATRSVLVSEGFRWADDRSLVDPASREVVDVESGSRRPATAAECGSEVQFRCYETPENQSIAGVLLEQIFPDGTLTPPGSTSSSTFRATVPATGRVIEFDALRVVPAPDGALVVLTLPAPGSPRSSTNGRIDWVTTSIFLLDPRTGVASFISTAQVSEFGYIVLAGRDHLVWRDRICGPEPGVTKIFSRRSGVLTEIRTGVDWPAAITPSGLIAVGVFNPTTLVDPETLNVRGALPLGVGAVNWSPDYRYAVVGQQFGRDGACY